MLRRLSAVALLIAAGAAAAEPLWPARWFGHERVKTAPLAPSDPQLFTEYGGETAETAGYQGPAGAFTATAWRFEDSTGSLAWFQAIRPPNAVPVRNAVTAATTPDSLTLARQNYVLRFEGWRPTDAELSRLWEQLPGRRSGGGLPVIPGYLPEKQRIRNSERYLLGPTSLARFEPRIAPELAGFESGAEGQLARFQTPAGEVSVTLFSYPTPQIARSQAAQFERLPGWVSERRGSLLAVVPQPPDPAAARAVLAGFQYELNFTWNEAANPATAPNVAAMLLAIFELTGLLLVVCVGGGFVFAIFWLWLRRRDALRRGTESPMIVLQIDDR
jgi:hypothetical protein